MPVRLRLGRLTATLALVLVLNLLFAALPLSATHTHDRAISGGHFYKQANGFGGRGNLGFSIWNGPEGTAFYSAFLRLGGVRTLGYPASRRYEQAGLINLVTQGALLQYHPVLGKVVLANTFEILEKAGLDDLLLARGIPEPITDDGSAGDFAKAKATRLGWLTHDAIKRRFLSAGGEDAAIELYGLPMSKPQAFGAFISQRFQRVALQYWVEDVPGIAARGDVTSVLGGDLLKEFDLVPAAARLPHLSNERPAPVDADSNEESLRFGYLFAEGASVFSGSPDERVHNIALAASKLHGYVIEPGATFSFLEALGPITKEAGYEESLIIWADRTVSGVGGGVCQVSTTVFRAAFWAGLPITERHQHLYRVSYYESDGSPPGFDATIYNPGLDLRFVNDSAHPILLQAHVDTKAMELSFTLRGKELNRAVEMLPVVEKNPVAPGPPLPDKVDPSLPAGERLQIEWAAAGIETVIRRSVAFGDETHVDAFWSKFVPWRELWLVGPTLTEETPEPSDVAQEGLQ